ncbi:MAG: hypothetical protein J7L19_02950 [Dehalococcoidia bacterium]|nr:hypothetical protein [Dehalococcoidia bacterium]
MKIRDLWMGVAAIIMGMLVLAFPELIRLIVGIGLIVIGILAIVRR